MIPLEDFTDEDGDDDEDEDEDDVSPVAMFFTFNGKNVDIF